MQLKELDGVRMVFLKKKKYWLVILSLFILVELISTGSVHAMGISKNDRDQDFSINYGKQKGAQLLSANQESRIVTFTISIPQLGDRQRNIQVYLPPDYDSSDQAYPVFYLHDGEYLFNPPPEGVGDYRVDETLDRLISEGLIDGVIVVGIEHDRDHDWDEYIPWVNENMHDWVHRTNANPAQGGETFAFIDFIVNTLKPEIDSRYRTMPDRENTAIGGFCRGALFPVVAGVAYPEVFSKVMAMSPAVWMAEGGGAWLSNNQLIQYLNSQPLSDNVKFYIDIGTEEFSGNRPPVKDQNGQRITYPRAYVEGAQALEGALKSNGVPESNIYFRIIEGVEGKRDIWAERIDEVILWFFGGAGAEKPATPTTPPESKPIVPNSPTEESQEEKIFFPQIQTPEGQGVKTNTLLIIGIISGGGLLFLGLVIYLVIRFVKRK